MVSRARRHMVVVKESDIFLTSENGTEVVKDFDNVTHPVRTYMSRKSYECKRNTACP